MTAQIIPLTVSDLNTAINHEPRVRDLAIAERLGLADPHDIRRLIDANKTELESYGEVSGQRPENTGRGRPGTEYWLNEAQALLLCTFSRTAQAAQVRRSLITVFMDWRRGQTRTTTVHEHKRRIPPRAKPEALPGMEALPPAPHSLPKPSEPTQAELMAFYAGVAVDIATIRQSCNHLEATFFPNKAAQRRSA